MRRLTVRVVVHVDVVAAAHFGVAVRKLVDIARKVIVAHHFVESVSITDRIIRLHVEISFFLVNPLNINLT